MADTMRQRIPLIPKSYATLIMVAGVRCILWPCSKVNGAVLEAKSVSLSDVQAAIRAAADGDTVAGSCRDGDRGRQL